MATSGAIGNGGYQGRYLEFAWSLVSQDIQNNCSTIYWRVTVVGGTSSYYFHHRDYCDAFGEVLVNSPSRTKRYKGDLEHGYKTLYHDVNGNFSFGAHVVAAVYTSSVNEDTSGSWSLPTIPRQAHITNLPASFTDEENPWFDFTNPANWSCDAWLEPNPNGPHYAGRTVTGTGGRYTWNLTDAERKQLRQACKGNSCTIRIGLYSNGGTWASYHDRTFIIKDPNPIVGTPTWKSTNLTTLADTATVIKGYSNVTVTVPQATPVKQSTIKQYKVICGNIVQTSATHGTFNLENISDSIIKVYVEDSRGNTVEKILNISKYIEYEKPTITSISLSRSKGGIGTNVTLSYSGIFWNNNFGKLNNSLTVQYFYKVQGSGAWKQGTTSITPSISSNTFSGEFEIKGDLDASGFNVGYNYDFRIVVTDRITSVNKETILSKGTPNLAIAQKGIGIGCLYDEKIGGVMQIAGERADIKCKSFTYKEEEQPTGDYIEIWGIKCPIYTKTFFGDGGGRTSASIDIPIGVEVPSEAWIDWQNTYAHVYSDDRSVGPSQVDIYYNLRNNTVNIRTGSSVSLNRYRITLRYIRL